MRQYIDIINQALLTEAQRPKKPARTQNADPTSDNLRKAFEPKADQPLATTGNRSGQTPTEAPPEGGGLPGRTASGGQARARASGVTMTPSAAAHLGDLGASGIGDEISDQEAARRAGHDNSGAPTTAGATPEPVNPENLPAVVSNALSKEGPADFDPEWIQVRHLPGYLQSPIRALGRGVFGQFTDTPIEDIQVITTLTNPEDDVKRMMGFIRKNGIRDDEARIDFSRVMPGYQAETQLWRMVGYEFLLVKDMMGYYIYGWPGGRGVHLPAPRATKRLK